MTGRFRVQALAAAAYLAALLTAACAAHAPRVPGASPSAGVSFSQVGEILHESCEHCHNADDEKGGLLMESYASLVAGGEHGNALVPGDSAVEPADADDRGQAQAPDALQRGSAPARRRWS